MARIAFVNGRYVPFGAAMVHIEDRGYQFADGVYEVCELRGGQLVDEQQHLDRLRRSLGELRIDPPVPELSLRVIMRELARRNHVDDGLLYLQVTRGVSKRHHAFPPPGTRPSLVLTVRASDPKANARAEQGVSVVTVPESRWARVDIKSLALLANVLAKQAAAEAGAFEAWFVDRDGMVNEGSSSNAWIVTEDGRLVTAPTTAQILHGITRAVVIRTAERHGLALEQRRFSTSEAASAREAFLTSATTLVTPVIEIDGRPVGDGAPGETARALRRGLLDNAVVSDSIARPVAQRGGFS